MAKILLIEDDPLVVKMYKNVLSFEGFQMETAPNGTEGLKKAKQFMPDLIYLDIMMPKMNGIEVLENLKKDPTLKEIPVIMLTNLAGADNAEEALKKGAFAYMVKSEYKPKEVAQKAKEFFDKKGVKVEKTTVDNSVNPMSSQSNTSASSPTMTKSPSGVSEVKIEPPKDTSVGSSSSSMDNKSSGMSSASSSQATPSTQNSDNDNTTMNKVGTTDSSTNKGADSTEDIKVQPGGVVESPPAPAPKDSVNTSSSTSSSMTPKTDTSSTNMSDSSSTMSSGASINPKTTSTTPSPEVTKKPDLTGVSATTSTAPKPMTSTQSSSDSNASASAPSTMSTPATSVSDTPSSPPPAGSSAQSAQSNTPMNTSDKKS